MTLFAIEVEARAPHGDTRTVSDEAIDELMKLLEYVDGMVSGGPDWSTWDATIVIDAPTASDAAQLGTHLVSSHAAKAGLPAWPLGKVNVTREDLLHAETAEPNIPDLVSGPEVADILGVSRQRVHQLANEHPYFPEPLYRLGAGSLWTRSAIERFSVEWDRKPGRPRKTA